MVFGFLTPLWSGLIWAETFLFLSGWAIRILMLFLVPQRRTPASARAWLILIFLLPWIGLVLYLLLGRRRVAQQRQERHAAYQQAMQQPVQSGAPILTAHTGSPAIAAMPVQTLRPSERSDPIAGMTDTARGVEQSCPHLDERLRPTAALAQALTTLPILDGNVADLLDDYDAAIGRLVDDIDKATHHVHVLYYQFVDDATGKRVADALLRAVQRGVTCRLLIDGLGSRGSAGKLLPRLRAGGVQAEAIAPPSWAHLLRPHETSRLDLRNHRKIAVIDCTLGYTGSQNIVDADFRGDIIHEELVVRLRGPIVRQLQAIFLGDWYLDTHELLDSPELYNPNVLGEPPPGGSIVAQALPSGPTYPTEANQRLFISLLYSARSRIVLTTPYFIPDSALLNALETASLRGVDTHLVVSQAADQVLVGQAQRSFYAELLELGVQIHLYRAPLFLHAKHLSIDDDLAIIGSSNLDRRSFALNAEISMLFYGQDIAARLCAIQERYFAHAHHLTSEEWRQRPWPDKVMQNTARLMDEVL